MSETTHSPENDATPVVEWGVRFPSGAVESFGDDEARARRFALTTTSLRPDLPTLVMRRVVTQWGVFPPDDLCPACRETLPCLTCGHGL